MMKTKRLLLACLVLAVLVLGACGSKAEKAETPIKTLGNQTTTPEITTEISSDISSSIPTVPPDEVPTALPSEEPSESPTEPIANDAEEDAWIKGSNVHLRREASTDCEVLAVLQDGFCVVLLESLDGHGEWAHVQADDVVGYVHKKFVTAVEPETVPTEEPADTSKPEQTVILDANRDKSKLIIAIDPGHQARGNSAHEPIGPGASATKPKVSSGTSGISTGVPEYKLTLEVSLKLRDVLEARGYQVCMIRETHEVDISNKERAEIATEAGADIFVRIHADGSENTSINGILTLSPTAKNPYVGHLYERSYALSKDVLEAMVAVTGAYNRGVSQVDNMSGINWATIPVTIVEMGLMTNTQEDRLMQTDEYQMKLVEGIANGIDNYFTREN